MIYNTWQRSDSTEAFYTCMDVTYAGGDTPPPQWRDVGALLAKNALPVGSKVTLRVFNADGSDAERVETVLQTNQTSTTVWPLRVGQQVNASASYARIGVLQNGVITPVASASANRIHLRGDGRRHQLDIQLPPPPGDYDYVYPAGIGNYVPGQTVVKGSDGKLYGCGRSPKVAGAITAARLTMRRAPEATGAMHGCLTDGRCPQVRTGAASPVRLPESEALGRARKKAAIMRGFATPGRHA